MTPHDIQTLQFETTSYCNARCPHCGRFDDNGDLHPDLTLSHLDAEKILHNLELEKLSSLKEVVLEGDKGDPIMHPNIETFIDCFYNLPQRPNINLMTNGAIRNKTWWGDLGRKYPRLKLTFSIDGLEDTNHLYRVGVNFKKAIENAKALIDAGGHANWKFLIFKHNQHQVEQAQVMAEQLGFTSMLIKSADRNRFQGQEQWPVKIDGTLSHYIAPPTQQLIEQKFIIFKNTDNVKPNPVKITNRICPNMSKGTVYINHQGYAIPCCMMHFDTENNYFGKDRLVELTEGLENQSLLNNTLTQVLKNKLFGHNLVESLMGPEDQWHFNCVRSCHPHIIKNKREYDQSQ